MSALLQIISGLKPRTHSLGYVLSGKAFLDPRFGPSLHFKEAEWLLRNEQILGERDRREGLVVL